MNEKEVSNDLITPVALDFYTIEQLVSRFGTTDGYIRKMVREKKLKGVQVGKRLIFSAVNVQAFLKFLESEKETNTPIKTAKPKKV